jgi:hypothetical protein
MSFPISPTNGQTAVVNNTTYVYNSTFNAWSVQQVGTTNVINLTVTANVTAQNYNYANGQSIISTIYDLDDISFYTDGYLNSFNLTYNQSPITVASAYQLTVVVNGQLQPVFQYLGDKTWLNFIPPAYKGYAVVNNYYPNGAAFGGSTIKFADPPPAGASVVIRTVTGTTSQPPKIYPFKPLEISLAYE